MSNHLQQKNGKNGKGPVSNAGSRRGVRAFSEQPLAGRYVRRRRVYLPSDVKSAPDRKVLGGKGAELVEMVDMGIRVPPFFTIDTQTCNEYLQTDRLPALLMDEVGKKVAYLEKSMRESSHGAKFGDEGNPLLVSVRSGAPMSMPGMMNTILNLGLNDGTVAGLAEQSGNPAFAYSSYLRLIQMFGDVVRGIEKEKFDSIKKQAVKSAGAGSGAELTADQLEILVDQYKSLFQNETGSSFPQDVWTQLEEATEAVFRSWNTERAVEYRRQNDIPDDLGTAVNVQAMVFGNMGDGSCTGVCFTRSAKTGEKGFNGEWLKNAQGEEVVAGIRTPQKIGEMACDPCFKGCYKELLEIADMLEKADRDMLDIEFTVQEEKLYILQKRRGKRTAQAKVRIAVEMVEEGLITTDEALMRVSPGDIQVLMHPQISYDKGDYEEGALPPVLGKGKNASPGAAIGRVYFTSEDAVEAADRGEKVILVRNETTTNDLKGMVVSEGILTRIGGETSHASVIARQYNTPAVVGCLDFIIKKNKSMVFGDGTVVEEGGYISLDGTEGKVILGTAETKPAQTGEHFKKIIKLAKERKKLGVYVNADIPEHVEAARKLGAEGVGLARTEHMFGGKRLSHMQKVIMAKTNKERLQALQKLKPLQIADFEGIFRAMGGRPVIIRLLDPPLHEFLPDPKKIKQKAKGGEISKKEAREILKRREELSEQNPMLGTRGVRLGILMDGIYEMQVAAILTAALNMQSEGVDVRPEIMVPLVGTAKELEYAKEVIKGIATGLFESSGESVQYKVGTMIEIPRAALTAGEIAKHAEFFSFGTNDLTQMTYGLSRDDTAALIQEYIGKEILDSDPFVTIDPNGVGRLMKMAVGEGRSANEELEVGLCGEHGGEEKSIRFCASVGLDYVSCSGPKIPAAILAAAQYEIEKGRGGRLTSQFSPTLNSGI